MEKPDHRRRNGAPVPAAGLWTPGAGPARTVAKGRVVTLEYALFTHDDGALIEYRDDLIYLHGREEATLPKLQEAIEGLPVNTRRRVVLSAEDAYGPYDPELVVVESRRRLPEDLEGVGTRVAGECADGRIIMFTVTHVDGETIILDGNHHLAGKPLRFDVRIRDVREATEQELAEGRAFRIERDLPEPHATVH